MATKSSKPIVLFAHPTMEDMALGIAKHCAALTSSNQFERTIEFKKNIRWNKFDDCFPNLFIDDVRNMAGCDVIYIGSFHDPALFFEQLSIVYAIPKYLAKSFTFILPFFPTGTMERVDLEGQIATAKTMATLLSGIPLSAKGPAQLIIFDIHALQERFYFSDNIIPRLESAIPLLLRTLPTLGENRRLAIAFPDDGAFKRFHNFFGDMNTIICAKVRDGKKTVVKVKDGDPSGCHVIIVDDLVQSGGTLIECIKVLSAAKATKISAYVTHSVFPKQSWRRFLPESNEVMLDKFWITDSIPHARDIATHPPFQLLSLSAAIAATLTGCDMPD